jgi:hypothetical protein
MIFERKILSLLNIESLVITFFTENNEYERRTNAELKEFFEETGIVGVLKS